jgi:7-cyano-7-deazaguanine reductase
MSNASSSAFVNTTLKPSVTDQEEISVTEPTEVSITDIASKTLGSSASYAVYTDKFDSSLLNPMPRKLARDGWDITGDEFIGYDTWHCHEATFLLDNGYPIAGTLKFTYPSESEFMVESKSAKLYCNSFDMCKMGKNVREAISNYEYQIKKDLTIAIGAEVFVKFFPSGTNVNGIFPFDDYKDLYWELADVASEIEITDYSAEKNHLVFNKIHPEDHNPVSTKHFTNALRSRCRHTKQKDTGAAYIHIITKDGYIVDQASLFKQIVSLREVNEFHEFCAEKLYKSIMEHDVVTDCCVSLLYSRRGSLDINPTRASTVELLPAALISVENCTVKAMGQ